MRLTIEIIRAYGFEEKTSKPDWDDVQVEFSTPNGIGLSALTVCNNEPTNVDTLYGLDDMIELNTKEELDAFLLLSYEDVIKDVASKNEDFDIDEYL